jgi:hypothetical protein
MMPAVETDGAIEIRHARRPVDPVRTHGLFQPFHKLLARVSGWPGSLK